jgi:hypothetical protein
MNAARYSTLGSTMLLSLTIAACGGTPTTENRAGTSPAKTAEAIPPKTASREVELRPGTIIAVRLERALSTVRNRAGDTFAASLDQPIVVDDIEVLPRGTRFSGHVTTSKASGRLEGRAVLGITLDAFDRKGHTYPITTSLDTKTTEAHKKRNIKVIGGGAGLGALIGGLAGGGKGVAIGAAVGAGAGTGAAAATGKKDIEVPAETLFRFSLKSAVTVPD